MSYSFKWDDFFDSLRTIRNISRPFIHDGNDGSEILIILAIILFFVVVIVCFYMLVRHKEKMYEREELKERQSKSIILKDFDTNGSIQTSAGLINNQSDLGDLIKALGPVEQFDFLDGVTFYRTVNMINVYNYYFKCTVSVKNDRLDTLMLKPDIDSFWDKLGGPSKEDMLVSLPRKMFSLYDNLTRDVGEESADKHFKISGRCVCKLIHEDEEIPFIFFSFYINN